MEKKDNNKKIHVTKKPKTFIIIRNKDKFKKKEKRNIKKIC